MTAIRMLQKGGLVGAGLLPDMAAAQLALEILVAAAMCGQRCTEAGPGWWKGHWCRGQALMKVPRNTPPPTAMPDVKALRAGGGRLQGLPEVPHAARPQVRAG